MDIYFNLVFPDTNSFTEDIFKILQNMGHFLQFVSLKNFFFQLTYSYDKNNNISRCLLTKDGKPK